MKKIYMLFVLSVCLLTVKAQWTYSSSVSSTVSGTYTDLGTNGTAIVTNSTGGAMTYDDANSSVQNIGFTFAFNGTNFTQFVLNSNGFIKMGATAPATSNIFYSAVQGTTGGCINSTETNLIYPFNHDLMGGTSPEYRVYTSGVSPNRICTIQFKNIADKIATATILTQFSKMDFQIKLYETSNNIEFVYGSWLASVNATNFVSVAVGIKGATIANSVNATKASTGAWNSTTFLNGNYTGNTHNTRNTFLPDAGRTYQFNSAKPNDLNVAQVYTLGKLPLPQGAPHTVSTAITNVGLNTLTNVAVNLNITGSNSFTNSKTIASIAPGASSVVVFDAYTPTVLGDNSITVSLPSDDVLSNNTKTVVQKGNANTWSYANGPSPSGGIGFNGNTGDIVAKFNTSSNTNLSQVSVNFTASGEQFQIGVWDATGAAGVPGNLLWASNVETTTTGVFVLPISPSIAIPAGDFYVGVMQIGGFVAFAYQTESPVRTNTFYYTIPSGSTTWTDFAPANLFRFMIEPKLSLPNDASVSAIVLPGTNTCLSNNETVNVTLSNVGNNDIPVGAATLTLKVRGANTSTLTRTNSTLIASGSTEVINFTGVNFSNPGVNFDTVFVVYSGDIEKENDTLKSRNTTATSITSFPATENFEAAFPVFSYLKDVSGGGQFWAINTGKYKNLDLTDSLAPHAGNNFLLFNSWNAAAGTVNRLYSNCISLPAASQGGPCGGTLTFFMSHDSTFGGSADSLFISISTDKGVTWNRLPTGYGRYDASFIFPGWRQETVDISAYAGQTFQIGFEGVSSFGNVIGLDDIVVNTTCPVPVNLNDFNAKRSGKLNLLTWNTSQEINTRYFVIEHSIDGRNYMQIGQVNAAGYSTTSRNYSYTDNRPAKGINYYRLRIVDQDNTAKYSAIRSVRNDGTADIAIFPNPVNNRMTISINSDYADAAQLSISDVSGKEVYASIVNINEGNNEIPVILNKLSGGSYVVKVKLSNDLIYKKFNKL